MAVTLRQVERFEITLGSGVTSDTHTLSTTLLDTGKAFLLYGFRNDGNDPDHSNGTVRITSTTQLTAARAVGGGTLTFIGYVCEFTAGVAVIRGAATGTAGTIDTDVSSVITDLSKAWVRAHQRTGFGGSSFSADDVASAELVDVMGTETVRVYTQRVEQVVDWEAVQFEDCAVQRATLTLGNGVASDTLSISAADQSRAFLLCGQDQIGQSDSQGAVARQLIRARLTADDTVTVDRDESSSVGVNCRVQVIEFTSGSGITVEAVSSTFAAADGQNDHTISAVSGLDKAAALCSVNGGQGKAANPGDDQPGAGWFTPDLTTTTNLQLTRLVTADTADVEAYVIDFGAAPAPAAVLPGPTYQGLGMGMG